MSRPIDTLFSVVPVMAAAVVLVAGFALWCVLSLPARLPPTPEDQVHVMLLSWGGGQYHSANSVHMSYDDCVHEAQDHLFFANVGGAVNCVPVPVAEILARYEFERSTTP